MKNLPTTYDLEGFVDNLEFIIRKAKRGELSAVSINLSPTGHGHYAFQEIHGKAELGDSELADPSFDLSDSATADTAPGKGKKP